MIEPIVYFVISLTFAGLIAWALMPLIRSRTAQLIARERDAAHHKLAHTKSELDIKNRVVSQLKSEREMLKSENEALRRKLGTAAQDIPSTQAWSTGVGPLFVELDSKEREQLVEKEMAPPAKDHNDGAYDKTAQPLSLRVIKNGSK
jgi:predicted PhzF superfamily epimerase YddE/YHI9